MIFLSQNQCNIIMFNDILVPTVTGRLDECLQQQTNQKDEEKSHVV